MAYPPGRTFTWSFLALLVVGVGVAYGAGFRIGFFFDDAYGIASNPVIRSLANTPRFFTDPFAVWIDHTQVDLRPFLLVTFALNYAVSGLQPWSYHVVNLALHLVGAFLVFLLVRDHLWWPVETRGPGNAAQWPAAAAALFFALAPLNSQPVNYIWARSALLCVTLYLAAFLLLLRRRWVAGGALYTLALLTKAIAVTLPVLLVIHDLVYRDRERHPTVMSWLRDWRRLVVPVTLSGSLAVAYVLYRAAVLPSWTAEARKAGWVTPWIWFMSEWSALLYYVRLFLWPDGLSVDHAFPYATSLLQPRAWGALLVLLAWAAVALAAWRWYPQATFATAWFFVTLAPESTFAPLAEVINDHRPYIATSLGLSVLLAWVLYTAAGALPGRAARPAFAVVCVLLLVPAVIYDRHRTWEWLDPIRMWEATIRVNPLNSRAWLNAGVGLMGRGEMADARFYLERARELSPAYDYVHMNLSILEAAEGRREAALRSAQEAVRLNPSHALTHVFHGIALEKLGRKDEALAAYRRAAELDPRDVAARNAIARLDQADAGPPAVETPRRP